MDLPLIICVVGAGPRGTSVVERLIASAPELLGGRALRIEVIDPYPPGPGASGSRTSRATC